MTKDCLSNLREMRKAYFESLRGSGIDTQREDVLSTSFDLMEDALLNPKITRMEDVASFINTSKRDLTSENLTELRKVRLLVLEEVNVAVENVFPGSRQLNLKGVV